MKSRIAIAIILSFLIQGVSFNLAHGQLVGPNIDITAADPIQRQRVEPTIAVDPRNSNIIVAGAQDLRLKQMGLHRWNGYYLSTDGGITWSSSLLPGFPSDTSKIGMTSPLKQFNATSDPVLAFDNHGNVYYTGIAFNIDPSGNISGMTAFVAKYVNDGASYSSVTLITGNGADKPWVAVDTTGGQYDGSIYVVFDYGCGLSICFARSTDGGKTYSRPVQLASGLGFFPGVAVDGNGNIFVSALGLGNRILTIFGGTIIVVKSTDGGLTFQQPIIAAAKVYPIFGSLPGNLFRALTIPQITADRFGIYVAYDSFKDNDAQVQFVGSTDGGNTWSLPVTVNDQKRGYQFFPSIAVSGGIINIVWYDGRLGQQPNGTITALNLFYAYSRDGGASFSANIRVTTSSFDPNLVLRTDDPNTFDPFMGDYIQVAATPTAVHPIWSDNRNACNTIDPTFGCVDQDVFTTTITF